MAETAEETTGAETGDVQALDPSLKNEFEEEGRERLQEELDLDNIMGVPELAKITVNMGLGDVSDQRERVRRAKEELAVMTGQEPVVTEAKRSIAGFNIRKGDPVGLKVTLRGERMYAFLERFVTVVIPRIKDFSGLDPSSFDGDGNFSMGLDEQVTFPEIEVDAVHNVQGMDVCITTTAENDEEGLALLNELGMPFQDVES
jgi:large subunit ribosomal protein L5